MGISTVATVDSGRRPKNPPTFEKVPLFATLHLLVNALLAKGEKVEQYFSNIQKGVLQITFLNVMFCPKMYGQYKKSVYGRKY